MRSDEEDDEDEDKSEIEEEVTTRRPLIRLTLLRLQFTTRTKLISKRYQVRSMTMTKTTREVLCLQTFPTRTQKQRNILLPLRQRQRQRLPAVSISSSSMDPNIINCADGGCPEGTADSITDLSPGDQDAVKDALEIDPESLNKESRLLLPRKL